MSKTMTAISIVMMAISVFSARALYANEQTISGSSIGGKIPVSTEQKRVLHLKKKFIAQNLPTPKVTGSVKQNAQNEDEAMISAIIFQDLKRAAGQK